MQQWNSLMQRFERFNSAEKIIVINVVFFVVPFFLNTLFFLFKIPIENIFGWFELSPELSRLLFQPWSLLTYGFLHGSFGHILWNMLLLYYSSQFFFTLFNAERFLNIYLTGILLGGLVFVVSYAVFPVFQGRFPPMVGSSAGVMAVLIFCSTYMPDMEVRLLFFNVKLKYLGIALVVLDIIQIPAGNTGGHLAHLGGAGLGFLSARGLMQGNEYALSFVSWGRQISAWFSPKKKSPLTTVHRKTKTKATSASADQAQIDRILDKISASGYDSLSKEEKEILFNSGKN